MPTKKRRKTKFEKYLDNPEFSTFVDDEFRLTSKNATMEELAEFAFGSVDDAVKAFEVSRKS